MKPLLTVMLFAALSFAQDAAELEAQYGTCAKHHIPAEKCTPEIYRQLKEKDNAPPDPATATALQAIREYQGRLKNPESMQVHTAYLTDRGALCLEIAGQNAMGGLSVSRVVYLTDAWKGRGGKGKWLDEGGFFGAASADVQSKGGSGYQVDRWPGPCQKVKAFGQGERLPGIDVTEKVNQALGRAKP